MIEEVDGVLLDAGGVLVTPDPSAIGELLRGFGLDGSEGACHRLHFERVHLADQLPAEAWEVVDHHLARKLGLAGEVAQRAARLFSSTFATHRSVPAAEAAEVMSELHGAARTLGVVSNSDGTLAARLAQDGLCSDDGSRGSPVAFVIDSAVVGVAKPSSHIFRLAVERLAAVGVDPARCLFVGDTVANDVVPAGRAGLIPVHLDPYGLCQQRDHRHISSLRDLLGKRPSTSEDLGSAHKWPSWRPEVGTRGGGGR